MNFIEKNTKKVAVILGLATAFSAVTTVYAAQNADGWHGTGADRTYKEEGQIKVNSWLFDEEGSYYLNENGNPITSQWKTINGSIYYFDTEGHRVNGKQIIDGHEYTFQKSGVLLTGWSTAKDSYYSKYGVALTGVQTIDGAVYNFGDDGKIKSGWVKIDDTRYYFNEDGSMAVGETSIDGKKYNFNEDGTITKGWKTVKGEKYYYSDYGFMTKGWKTIDGDKYYFNKKGQAATDTEYAGYEFDEDGVATKIKKKKVESEAEEASETRTVTNSSSSTNSSSNASSSTATMNPVGSGNNATAAAIAASQVGSGYVWGGTSPGGFDCSGLTYYAYAQAGISIPRTAGGQGSIGSAVSYDSMQPGDLIVWNGGQHVSIYTGGGMMVHATNPSTGVISSSVSFWSGNSGQSITAIRRP